MLWDVNRVRLGCFEGGKFESDQWPGSRPRCLPCCSRLCHSRRPIAPEFVLVNKSGRTIDEFYISPCWAKNWGNNQISWTPVWTSKTFTIKDIEPGCYNLMSAAVRQQMRDFRRVGRGDQGLDDHALDAGPRGVGRLLLYRPPGQRRRAVLRPPRLHPNAGSAIATGRTPVAVR